MMCMVLYRIEGVKETQKAGPYSSDDARRHYQDISTFDRIFDARIVSVDDEEKKS